MQKDLQTYNNDISQRTRRVTKGRGSYDDASSQYIVMLEIHSLDIFRIPHVLSVVSSAINE